jgi:hypothetical protein
LTIVRAGAVMVDGVVVAEPARGMTRTWVHALEEPCRDLPDWLPVSRRLDERCEQLIEALDHLLGVIEPQGGEVIKT